MQAIRPQYTSDGVLSGLCKQGFVTRPKNTILQWPIVLIFPGLFEF